MLIVVFTVSLVDIVIFDDEITEFVSLLLLMLLIVGLLMDFDFGLALHGILFWCSIENCLSMLM